MLFKTIDNLFLATRYGVWFLGLLGIVASIILVAVNISLGITSALIFVACFLISITISLALLPESLIKGEFLNQKRFTVAAVTAILAVLLAGIIYFCNGGFPELNLLFI